MSVSGGSRVRRIRIASRGDLLDVLVEPAAQASVFACAVLAEVRACLPENCAGVCAPFAGPSSSHQWTEEAITFRDAGPHDH
ncbi:hypothetical protein [Streptomyces bacillaris]|uniref:hypothetical protein n=1 Tax=Streptomyces bacillaris TaxID=68179 RepID=UPI0036656490